MDYLLNAVAGTGVFLAVVVNAWLWIMDLNFGAAWFSSILLAVILLNAPY